MTTSEHSIPRVAYFYDHPLAFQFSLLFHCFRTYEPASTDFLSLADVGNYNYGQGHPMKPHRIRMTQSLVVNYGLYKKLQIHKPPRATFNDLTKFHADEYVGFLRSVSASSAHEYGNKLQKFNVGDDCPVFDGVYEFCQISAGGSIASAVKLNHGDAESAINWAGGLHHAKKIEASGFCYVNDIVLAVLELLKYHARVLYIDIDVHHGDGVEEAFYTTDRVMTASFHKYGEFFPGTGELKDVGYGHGKYYSVNVPLRDGINDDSYRSIFQPVISHIMQWYRPSAVILQCGSDSLAGDRLGCFNLSSKGHSECVEFVRSFGLPTIYLGGGGYTIRNVAKCWAYETSVILGQPVPEEIPFNDYFEYYGPDYSVTVPSNNMQDLNSKEYLDKVLCRIVENLRNVQFAPSVQLFQRPDDLLLSRDQDMSDAENEDLNDSDSESSESEPFTLNQPLSENVPLTLERKKTVDDNLLISNTYLLPNLTKPTGQSRLAQVMDNAASIPPLQPSHDYVKTGVSDDEDFPMPQEIERSEKDEESNKSLMVTDETVDDLK